MSSKIFKFLAPEFRAAVKSYKFQARNFVEKLTLRFILKLPYGSVSSVGRASVS